MLDFNNCLIAKACFPIFVACEGRVKFLVNVALCERIKNPNIKNARFPRAHWHPDELHQRSWHCCSQSFSCQGLKVWLYLNIMAYVLGKECEPVSHIVMTPMDKPVIHTWHCMINVKSLAAWTCGCNVLLSPAVPKAERVVELQAIFLRVRYSREGTIELFIWYKALPLMLNAARGVRV